jgi:hypothetical protein
MKDDDISHPIETSTKDDSDKESAGKTSLSPKKLPVKPRSSGRGLYITAIVLGIIIVVLLVLYVYLALTYKKPAHSSVVPMPAIIQIAKN